MFSKAVVLSKDGGVFLKRVVYLNAGGIFER